MTKNLLKQVMSKEPKGRSKESKEIIDFTEGLSDAIQNGYLAQTKSYFSKKDYFAPSTLTYGAGECARFWYLAFDGAVFEDHSDAYGVANRTQGSLGHERIQKAVLNSGLLVEDMEFDKETRKYNKQVHPAMEFRVKTEDPPINGYGDVMLNYNGNRLLGEIKTSPNDAFEYKKISRKPKLGHLMQLIIYMKILKVDKGVVIYENKDNHELLTIPISINDHYSKWVDNAFDWMRGVRKAWVDRSIPQKTYRSNSKICKACPLQKACAEAETGEIKIKPLELLENETL